MLQEITRARIISRTEVVGRRGPKIIGTHNCAYCGSGTVLRVSHVITYTYNFFHIYLT